MADRRDRNRGRDRKDRGGGRGKRGGGGGGPRVYIVDAKLTEGDEPSKVNIEVKLKQTYDNPQHSIPTRVLFQDKSIGVVEVKNLQTFPFNGIKVDETKSRTLTLQKAGEKESIDLEEKEGPAKTTPAQTKQSRLEVRVSRVLPNGINPVQILTRDEKLKLAPGVVRINPSQRYIIYGEETKELKASEVYPVQTENDGYASVDIRLLEFDGMVAFTHVKSGQTVHKLLLKEG